MLNFFLKNFPYFLMPVVYLEKQENRKLTRIELIKVILSGQIGEAQWLAAVATGVLYDEHIEHHKNVVNIEK